MWGSHGFFFPSLSNSRERVTAVSYFVTDLPFVFALLAGETWWELKIKIEGGWIRLEGRTERKTAS